MATISAKLVKELRKKTGAGMMDCKKALTETDGDIDKATQLSLKSTLKQTLLLVTKDSKS